MRCLSPTPPIPYRSANFSLTFKNKNINFIKYFINNYSKLFVHKFNLIENLKYLSSAKKSRQYGNGYKTDFSTKI